MTDGVAARALLHASGAASLFTSSGVKPLTQHEAEAAAIRREIEVARWIRAALLLGVALALAWPAAA